MSNDKLLTKINEIETLYLQLEEQLSLPETASDPNKLKKISKRHKDLSPIVSTFRRYKKLIKELNEAKEMLSSTSDKEIISLAKEEISLLEEETAKLKEELMLLMLPKDPNDEKNVILEIRAGAGGDEASIFVGDLFRMYCRYAENQGWKVEIMSASEASSGGYKEIIATIIGKGAYSKFKYESGVHRVQRVPETESQGRIHTSTASVAILPEAEDVEVKIDEKDLRIDVFRASGPGGQSVNTTDSAVRITHLPTGIVVAMQDEKSQHKNKEKALKVLRARLLEKEQEEALLERQEQRKNQVGSAARAEKVRTYNYPQSRITDHRINLSLYSLQSVLDGDLDQLIDPLTAYFQAEALKESGFETKEE